MLSLDCKGTILIQPEVYSAITLIKNTLPFPVLHNYQDLQDFEGDYCPAQEQLQRSDLLEPFQGVLTFFHSDPKQPPLLPLKTMKCVKIPFLNYFKLNYLF